MIGEEHIGVLTTELIAGEEKGYADGKVEVEFEEGFEIDVSCESHWNGICEHGVELRVGAVGEGISIGEELREKEDVMG